MNLVLDIGNTAVKWATFEGAALTDHGHGMPDGLLTEADRVLACASGAADTSLPLLTSATPLPIRLDYKTPDTLGPDRVAAACGAWALHPGEDCLVVDAGTCITVDFIDAKGVYHGGAILPGISMGLKALHTFTARLPLVGIEAGRKAPVLGRSTEECIVAGTLGAATLALAGYVALYRQRCPDLQVLLTGGDAPLLAAQGGDGWHHIPLLTLIGLNAILETQDQAQSQLQS